MERAELIIAVQTVGVPAALDGLRRVEQQAERTARQMSRVCGQIRQCALPGFNTSGPSGPGSAASPLPSPADLSGWDRNPEDMFGDLTRDLADDWRASLQGLEQSGRDVFQDLGRGLEDGFQDLGDGLSDSLDDLGRSLEDAWDTDLAGQWQDMADGLQGLWDLDPQDLFGDLGQWLNGLLDLDAGGLLGDLFDWASDLLDLDLGGLFDDLSGWLDGLLDLDFGGLLDGLLGGLGDILDLDGLVDGITSGLGDLLDLGGLFDGIFSGGYSPEEARQHVEGAVAAAERAAALAQQTLAAGQPLSPTLLMIIDQAMQEIRRLGARAGYSGEQMDSMTAHLRDLLEAVRETGGVIFTTADELDELSRIMDWGNDQIDRQYQGLADSLGGLTEAFTSGAAPARQSQGAAGEPPASDPGRFPVTINAPISVNAQPGDDAEAIAEAVRRRMADLARNGLDAATERHGRVSH